MSESPTSRAPDNEPAEPEVQPAVSEQAMREDDPAASADEDAPQTPAEPTAASPVRKPGRWAATPYRSIAVLTLVVIGISTGIYLAVSGSPQRQSAVRDSGNVMSTTPATGAAGRTVPGNPSTPATRQAGGTAASDSPVSTSDTPVRLPGAPQPLKPVSPARVKSWNAGQGGAALSRVTSEAGNVLMAHGAGQYPQMLQACRALSASVKAAKALPAIPDAAMQRAYAKSLAAFDSGIAKCVAGISLHLVGDENTVTNVNQADIGQAIRQFDLGMTDLYVATEALRKQ